MNSPVDETEIPSDLTNFNPTPIVVKEPKLISITKWNTMDSNAKDESFPPDSRGHKKKLKGALFQIGGYIQLHSTLLTKLTAEGTHK